jgi:hypothetical protein
VHKPGHGADLASRGEGNLNQGRFLEARHGTQVWVGWIDVVNQRGQLGV